MAASRVLVCGTNYGRFYLHAIERSGGAFEVAAILGRGSERSRETAARLRVPLVTRVADVPEGIDLACAAMGTPGLVHVLELLDRGIPVLCEHPVTADFVQTALGRAGGVRFDVNGHFARLDAPRAFLERCRHVRKSHAPLYVEATLPDRGLYAAIDILHRAVGEMEPLSVRALSKGSFVSLCGNVGSLEATFRLQDATLEDADPRYVSGFRLAVGFRSGILTLGSLSGPVLWTANEYATRDRETPLVESIYLEQTTSRALGDQRVAANLEAMTEVLRAPQPDVDSLLQVSRVWETLGRELEA